MNAIQQLLTEHIGIWTDADTENKSGRGRSSGNAASVYGIRKLRELILELAVRGKLVPQDANDEPASVLLKRIQAEKARLLAEGKIKKDKPLPPITDDKKPFELPQGWEWVHLPDVSDYKVGKTPATKNSAYWTSSGDGFSWVSIADLSHDGRVIDTNKQITGKAVSEVFRCEPAPAGTILMSFKLTLGKISILNMPAFHNEAIISIYPNQGVAKDFLFKVLPARAMNGNSKSAIKGNTLNSESIAALMIPLPPLAEQHRIVAKVDELMALCNQLETRHNAAAEAHEKLVSHLLGTLTQSQNAAGFRANWQRIAAHFDTLFNTEASIDALKQTLLQLAVMGKLVPQDPNDEPAGALLKRIQAEKARLIEEGKIKKDKPLPPIADDEKPFELPVGWAWARLNELARLITKGSSPKWQGVSYTDNTEDVMFVTSENVGSYTLLLDSPKYVEKKFNDIEPRSILENGDFLMNIVGASIGRTAVYDVDILANINQAVCLIRISTLNLSRMFLLHFFNSETCLEYMFDKQVDNARPNLSMGNIAKFLIPIPPLSEQRRIVAKVDELMALCDQLKTRLTAANQLQQKLADVVVEQAIA